MPKVIQLARQQWSRKVKLAPLRVYFTAVRYGWKEEAKEAARCSVSQPIEDVYVPEMEFVSAVVYHRLLKYHYNYQSTIMAITSTYEKHPNETWVGEMSNWYCGGYLSGGDKTTMPTLIAAPIVQRELRASPSRANPGRYPHSKPMTTPDVRDLIDESHALETKLQEELSKIKLEIELPHTF